MQLLNHHWQYAQYLFRHGWIVMQECFKYGFWGQGLTHDWSKFLPDEWVPYAKFFYGKHHYEKVSDIRGIEWSFGANETWTKEYWKQKFDEAWNLHQKRNRHHHQFYLLTMDSGDLVVLDMPMKYRKEMLADWRGASRAINGYDDTRNWYLKNKDKMKLHPKTRAWVEQELGGTND